MISDVTFIIQIEAKDELINQADLFCYSLNKQYPGFKVIILSENEIKISRNNTKTFTIPNKIYPQLKEKIFPSKIKERPYTANYRMSNLGWIIDPSNEVSTTHTVSNIKNNNF